MNISLFAFVPESLVSRDGFGIPVSPQPAHLQTQAESGAYLRDSSQVPRRRPFIYLNRHTPSGQSRVYRVMRLRTVGVHCRESAGTGPVNLKVVPNGCCLGRSPWTNQYAPLFPTPTIGMEWACGCCCCCLHIKNRSDLYPVPFSFLLFKAKKRISVVTS